MESETNCSACQNTNTDLVDDDDEFEEFDIGDEWHVEGESVEAMKPWEDDWDDDDDDDFVLLLRRNLEMNSEKK